MAARAVKTGYLALYNAACAAGWAYVLALTAAHFSAGRPASELYAAVSGPLKVVQTAALLEVVHAATGLVRSAVATTALQGACAARASAAMLLPRRPRSRARACSRPPPAQSRRG